MVFKKVKRPDKRVSDKYSFDTIIGKLKVSEQVTDLVKKQQKLIKYLFYREK